MAQMNRYTQFINHCVEPIDQPPELFFAGDLFGHIQLTADFIRLFKHRDLMANLCRCHRRRHSCRSCTHNRNAPRRINGR